MFAHPPVPKNTVPFESMLVSLRDRNSTASVVMQAETLVEAEKTEDTYSGEECYFVDMSKMGDE